MAKAFTDWTVLSHGPLEQLSENLWHVAGTVPNMALGRHMTIARRSDGGLVIHNAIALGDGEMRAIEDLGEVAFVLVPCGFHRLDAPNFHKRYPSAKILCPPGARTKVEQVVEVDGTYDDFPEDAAVSLEVLEGLRGAEGVMIVRSGDETALVFNDTLFNVPHGKGIEAIVMRLIGSTGGPKVTRVARWFIVKDKKALAAHLDRLASIPGLCRLVPGHGKVIETSAADTLRSVVGQL